MGIRDYMQKARLFTREFACFAALALLPLAGCGSSSPAPSMPSGPASQWVYYNSSGNLTYKTLDAQGDKIMDFSTAGYEQGDAKFEEFYIVRGTQVLMDTVSDVADDTYFFSTSSATQGPNVLRNGTFEGDASVEPHQRWATGLLVENTTVAAIPGSTQGNINLLDRGNDGTGQGWAIGWGVVWNSSANQFTIQQPPGSENWCIGCMGTQETTAAPGGSTVLPQGAIDSPGTYVFPSSLYQAQLTQRLGPGAVAQ